MHRFGNFVDLRPGSREREAEASLWPSFTDIMTVILMVFMLTMVVVIVKNANLVERIRLSQQLQAEAELRAAAAADSLAAASARNTDLQERIRGYNMQLILLNDEVERLQDRVDAKLAVIEDLAAANEDLLARLRTIELQLAEKDEQLEAARLTMAEVRAADREARRELREEIANLLARLEEKEMALVTLAEEKGDLELELARSRQDLSQLEDKYLRLVRPARSAAGKVVASVRVAREQEQMRYEFRGPGDTEGATVSLAELHRRLAAAKETHGDDLYVKIVIPDDSGLSYNEAWRFTKDILSRYDYYYEDGW
jgi:DNA repair exonuclease SbcCD ATPase subunit